MDERDANLQRLDGLPEDIADQIASILDLKGFLALSRANSVLRNYLWRHVHILKALYPATEPPPQLFNRFIYAKTLIIAGISADEADSTQQVEHIKRILELCPAHFTTINVEPQASTCSDIIFNYMRQALRESLRNLKWRWTLAATPPDDLLSARFPKLPARSPGKT